MDVTYLTFILTVVLLGGGILGITFALFGRGIALRIIAISLIWAAADSLLAYSIGRDGLTTWNILLGLVVIGPVGSGAMLLLARQIARPAREIAQEVSLLARQGILSSRSNASGRDEIRHVSESILALNQFLAEMVQLSTRIASGDLTLEVQIRSEQDLLGNAMRRMALNLRTLVGQVADNASGLDTASGQLASAADEAGLAAGQIAASVQLMTAGAERQSEAVHQTILSIQQISESLRGVEQGAQEQARDIEQAVQVAGSLSEGIRQVSGNAQAVTGYADDVTASTRASAQTVQATRRGLEEIRQRVNLSVEKVTEMGSRSEQISSIVTAIQDIAAQTNLLALNAAIEAARAGENGKGFSVVAGEVRKLAERAAASSAEIASIVKGIQRSVTEAVAAMQAGAKEVESGVGLAEKADVSLNGVLRAAEVARQQAEQASQAAIHMESASGGLLAAMKSVARVAERNTAAAEEISAGALEATQAMEQIAAISDQNSAALGSVNARASDVSLRLEEVTTTAAGLNEMAAALQSTISRFRLPDAVVEGKSASACIEAGEEAISGTGFIYRRDFVSQKFSDEGWQQVLASVSPATRRILQSAINPTGKYSQAAYSEMIAAIKQHFSDGNPAELAREMARYVARAEAKGVYRSVLQSASPQAALRALANLWRLQVPGGQMSVQQRGECAFTLEITPRVDAELCQHSMVGYIEGLLGLHNVGQLTVDHTACQHKGSSRCAYEVSWQANGQHGSQGGAIPNRAAILAAEAQAKPSLGRQETARR